MGERTDDIRPFDAMDDGTYADPVEGAPVNDMDDAALVESGSARDDDAVVARRVSPGDDYDATIDTNEDDPDAIREDILHTRSQMSGTIDAIQEKLSPQRIANQVTDSVKDATIGRAQDMVSNVSESAKGFGSTLMETIRENPIPLALVGLGVGWLVYRARSANNQHTSQSYGQENRRQSYRVPVYQGEYTATNYPGNYTGSQYQGYTGYTADQSSGGVRQRVSDAAAAVSDKTSDLGDTVSAKAGQLADTAQDAAGQLGYQAQYQAQRAQGWFQRSLDENPLMLAAIALAAGTAVGLAIPETRQENQLMGPARDTLLDRAQDVAQDTAQKAQQVAKTAAGAATDAAKQEANRQNLAPGSLTGPNSQSTSNSPVTH
ncbi:MAG: DUF3618 domain-containing protein [Ktedonobacterales bacterium]